MAEGGGVANVAGAVEMGGVPEAGGVARGGVVGIGGAPETGGVAAGGGVAEAGDAVEVGDAGAVEVGGAGVVVIGGAAGAGGVAELDGGADVAGVVQIGGAADAGSAVRIGGAVEAGGAAEPDSAAELGGVANLDGVAEVAGVVEVGGAAEFDGVAELGGVACVAGAVEMGAVGGVGGAAGAAGVGGAADATWPAGVGGVADAIRWGDLAGAGDARATPSAAEALPRKIPNAGAFRIFRTFHLSGYKSDKSRHGAPDLSQFAVSVAFVGLGAAVGLLRTREIDSIWAEDGQNFLTDALNRPWYEAIFTPFNGYFHVAARLGWALIALFPLRWAAVLNAGLDALVTSLLAVAVYRAARERLSGGAAALVGVSAALPIGFVPNALAQLQFPLVYAGLWMLLWRRASLLTVGLPGLAALNSMLGVLLLPVAVGGLVRYRCREWLLKLLGLLPGTLLQVGAMLAGRTERGLGERPEWDPAVLAALYLRWGVPHAFVGLEWPAWAPLDLGLLVPALLLGAALYRRAYASVRLAGILAGFGAIAGVVQFGAHGGVEDRYLVLVALPTIAAAACLADGAQQSRSVSGCLASRLPLVGFATVFAIVAAVNLRPEGPRDGSPQWGPTVARARAECLVQPGSGRVTVHIAQWPVLGWEAVLPCSRLR
ncbi:hypothetical protein AB0M46_24645 [Dactylosporangium sp. NPDC051485]|uniref:hypothetical protein n=1 Tax=Dactylosporangium sp. NPDC051485 TaxID=3154846 RepID=UPI003448F92B